MDKQFLLYCLGASVAVVVAGRWAANAVFPWLDGLWGRENRRGDPGLDELIQARLREWGKAPTRSPLIARPSEEEQATTARQALEAPPETAEQLAERQTLQRIYAFDGKRHTDESEAAHARRLLGLAEAHTPQQLRQAFKDHAKKFHPDTFRLDVFPAPLRKRLAARVHANYLAIQQAHDRLRGK